MFTIKICGITSVKDAQIAALAGADAIGLNFYVESPRSLPLEMAKQIVAALPSKVSKVGLWVNAPAVEVNEIAEQLDLDCIQLHGDEPPEYLAELVERPVLRAVRFGGDNQDELAEHLKICNGIRPLAGVLIDVLKPGVFGGTGEEIDWARLAECRASFGECPLILAGGLTPFNVEEAIAVVRPTGVDVASGVEKTPGAKDLLLVRAFTNAVKKAYGKIAAE